MKSMSERLAFPMYAVNDEDTQALWRAVRQLLAARGVVERYSISTYQAGVHNVKRGNAVHRR